MKTVVLLLVLMVAANFEQNNTPLKGAWANEKSGIKTIRIYTDNFFSVATYEATGFVATFGGRYKLNGNKILETIEFDTQTPTRIGTTVATAYQWGAQQSELNIGETGSSNRFERLDVDGPGKLAGAWLITGRYTNDRMNTITPGARRTMKILSGTRFQWIAYNVDTREFFGTGGGTYTTANGKYIESIDFFSRDQTRVGMSLSFDFNLTPEGDWRHRGKSSKGDPIDEVWSKREKLGM